MTIAFDSAASGLIKSAAGPATLSHTCGSGADRVVIVFVANWNSTDLVTGVTYGGVSMGTRVVVPTTATLWLSAWVLVNPPSGVNNVSVSFSTAASAAIVVASYTGVSQASPVYATNLAESGFAASPRSLAIGTPAGGAAVDCFALRSPSATLTPHASQTQNASFTDTYGTLGVSLKDAATAMEWTFSPSGSATASLAILALAPAASGAAALAGDAIAGASASATLGSTVVRTLELLAHVDAVGATAVKGVVFEAPTAPALIGAKIGEFSAQSFDAAAVGGQARLRVPVSVFGGSALLLTDTPVCVWEGTSAAASALGSAQPIGSVGLHECVVVDV